MDIYGCNFLVNIHGRDMHLECPWKKQGVCTHKNPALITSTLYGAYPNDCPLQDEDKEEEEK